MNFLKKIRNNFILFSVIFSILTILLGIVLVMNPEKTSNAIAGMVGLLILAAGIGLLIKFFVNRDSTKQYVMYFSLVITALGLIILINPDIIINFVSIFIGIYILIRSFADFQRASDCKIVKYDKWWIFMIMAVIKFLIAVFIITQPFVLKISIMILIGVILIIDGISNIIAIIKTINDVKNIKKH